MRLNFYCVHLFLIFKIENIYHHLVCSMFQFVRLMNRLYQEHLMVDSMSFYAFILVQIWYPYLSRPTHKRFSIIFCSLFGNIALSFHIFEWHAGCDESDKRLMIKNLTFWIKVLIWTPTIWLIVLHVEYLKIVIRWKNVYDQSGNLF